MFFNLPPVQRLSPGQLWDHGRERSDPAPGYNPLQTTCLFDFGNFLVDPVVVLPGRDLDFFALRACQNPYDKACRCHCCHAL